MDSKIRLAWLGLYYISLFYVVKMDGWMDVERRARYVLTHTSSSSRNKEVGGGD